jgi:hypothetical protein
VGKNDVLQRGKEVVRRQLDFFEQRYWEDDRQKVVLGAEVVGNGLGEDEVRVVFAHVDTWLGGPDGGGHGDE